MGRPGSDGADLQMLLTNADGSFAEMSGNGIRCLVQAAVAAAMVKEGTVDVDTGAGRRQVEYRDLGSGLGLADVDMGPAGCRRTFGSIARRCRSSEPEQCSERARCTSAIRTSCSSGPTGRSIFGPWDRSSSALSEAAPTSK